MHTVLQSMLLYTAHHITTNNNIKQTNKQTINHNTFTLTFPIRRLAFWKPIYLFQPANLLFIKAVINFVLCSVFLFWTCNLFPYKQPSSSHSSIFLSSFSSCYSRKFRVLSLFILSDHFIKSPRAHFHSACRA